MKLSSIRAVAERRARSHVEFERDEGKFWADEFGEEWKPLESYSPKELRKEAAEKAHSELELALVLGPDSHDREMFDVAYDSLFDCSGCFVDYYVEEFMRAVA